jgi:hypothetical protein
VRHDPLLFGMIEKYVYQEATSIRYFEITAESVPGAPSYYLDGMLEPQYKGIIMATRSNKGNRAAVRSIADILPGHAWPCRPMQPLPLPAQVTSEHYYLPQQCQSAVYGAWYSRKLEGSPFNHNSNHPVQFSCLPVPNTKPLHFDQFRRYT